MSAVVVLDAGPIGLVCRTRRTPVTVACQGWLRSLAAAGRRVIVPEIADYEVRREMLRRGRTAGVAWLDSLSLAHEYLPLTTEIMRLAANLWAQSRRRGQPTAGDNTIDADVILAAQALSLKIPTVVIATTNVGHLSRFVPAEEWQKIAP